MPRHSMGRSSVGAGVEGIRRRNNSTVVGTTATITAADHDVKMPNRGITPTRATSNTIFATANTVFSTGTHTARRMPVSALSCNTKTHHNMVATTNHTV